MSRYAVENKTRKRFLASTILVLIAGFAAYLFVIITAPSPKISVTLTFNQEVFTASDSSAQATVDAQDLPTAIGWLDDDQVWSNDETIYSLASISKLVTMLVCLEERPLEGDPQSWPAMVWGYEDWERQQEYWADDGVVYPIEIGTEIALDDVLHLIFLPSANDYASAFTYSVFDSNAEFIAAVYDWAERHNMSSLEFVEPTGLNDGNRANVADLIRIARLALAHPVISKYIQTASHFVPEIGYIENTNLLLFEDDSVIGVKTGRSFSAGFNFIAAAKDLAGEREVVKISATMRRGSIEERAESGRVMLAEIGLLPEEIVVFDGGSTIAVATGWDEKPVNLIASESVIDTFLPGESAEFFVELDVDDTVLMSGETVGTLRIVTPSGEHAVAITAESGIAEPSFGWRFTHPFELLRASFA